MEQHDSFSRLHIPNFYGVVFFFFFFVVDFKFTDLDACSEYGYCSSDVPDDEMDFFKLDGKDVIFYFVGVSSVC